MIAWKLRTKYYNVKWTVLWFIINALGLEEWADRQWYKRNEPGGRRLLCLRTKIFLRLVWRTDSQYGFFDVDLAWEVAGILVGCQP